MSDRASPRVPKMLIFIPYGLAVLVMLFIFGRYFLRLGDPPGPPAQGAEVASLRGGGVFTLEHLFSREQLPALLVEVLQEAPPLASP